MSRELRVELVAYMTLPDELAPKPGEDEDLVMSKLKESIPQQIEVNLGKKLGSAFFDANDLDITG